MFETDRVVEVATKRTVRIAFGTVLIAGALVLVANELNRWGVQPVLLVPLTWACAFIAGAWVRMVGTRPMPGKRVRARLDASLVLPSIGIALMLPLTLHLPVVLALGGDFAGWVRISLVVTGITHVVVAAMVGIRAAQLAAGRTPLSITAIYLCAIGVVCVPFAILMFLPPLLVGVTGLAFIPLLGYQRRLAERERAALPDVFLPHARLVA